MARPKLIDFPCPQCGERSLFCYYSRVQGQVRVRSIICQSCGHKFFLYARENDDSQKKRLFTPCASPSLAFYTGRKHGDFMSLTNFHVAHKFTAQWEGGLSDHPADRGGITAYGASLAFVKDIASTSHGVDFLRSLGVAPIPVTRETIRRLTPEQVAVMFRREFWDKLDLDVLPLRQAVVLYDAAVNHGPKQAVKFSQRGFNSLVTYGDRLVEDGIIGPKTRAALKYVSDSLLKAIVQSRRDFYSRLVASKPDQRVFLAGWNNRANALERYVIGLV